MSSKNRDDLNSSFIVWIPLFSFSYLISVTRTSNIIFKGSGDSGHSCLVFNLRKIVYSNWEWNWLLFYYRWSYTILKIYIIPILLRISLWVVIVPCQKLSLHQFSIIQKIFLLLLATKNYSTFLLLLFP